MDPMHSSRAIFLFVLTLAALCGVYPANAQQGTASHTTSIDTGFNCGTDVLRDFWLSRNPELKLSIWRMDSVLAQKAIARSRTSGPQLKPQNGTVLFIPVVFHVIHQGGAENISDAQVHQAVESINDGLRNRGAAHKPDGVDLMIELCLAERDPDGNPVSPITRQTNVLTEVTMETQDDALKNLVRWDPLRYLNVWVVREITSSGMGSGVAAYATLPFMAGSTMDGIVTEARWVSGSASGSTVMVHELGHYFGLWHTFQGGCGNNNCLTDGDGVCDTPPDGTTQASRCDDPQNSCTSDPTDTDPRNPFRSSGLGGKGDVPDMVTNFMDYGDLACMTRFTPGQDVRMHDAILQYRQALLASAACIPACTIPPEVAFTPGDTSVLVQTELTFTNSSESGLTFKWLVDDVLVSEGHSMTFTFKKLGKHTVTLIGYRNAGTDSVCAAKVTATVEVTLEIAKDYEWTLKTSGLHPNSGNVTADGALSIGRDGSVWTAFRNVARSMDEGVTWDVWSLESSGRHTPCIDAHDSMNAILTTAQPHAYFTNDGGQNWQRVEGSGTHTYACTYLGDPKRMLFIASTGNASQPSCVTLTTNGGASWEKYYYPHAEIIGIEYLGGDDLIAIARIPNTDRASILCSTTMGMTWSDPIMASTVDLDSWGLSRAPCDSTKIVVANEDGGLLSDMFVTSDLGINSHKGIPTESIKITGAVRHGDRYIYAHTLDAGILMSTDHGFSWQAIGGPGGRIDSWMFDNRGDSLIYAMGDNGDVWQAKRLNPVGEIVESRHDKVLLTVRDVRTDTVGGTVWMPIHSNGLSIHVDLSFRLTFDPELVFKGVYDRDGEKIPVIEIDQAAGYVRLVVPAHKSVLGSGNVASIEFEMALGGGRVFGVGVDSIQLLSPRVPTMPQCAEFVYTYESQGSSAVTIGPEGCGTEVLGNFVRKGKLPSLRITPNPAQDHAILTSDAMLDDVVVRVISATGIVKMERSLTFAPGKQVRLDTQELANGAYQIVLSTRSGQLIARSRLIKQ